MARVYIAIPNTGQCHINLVAAMVRMTTVDLGHTLKLDISTEKPVDHCRNLMIKSFLASDFDYLFFIDTDNPPRIEKNPLELVDLDKDVMVLPTPVWNWKQAGKLGQFPIFWNCFDHVPEQGGWTPTQTQNGLKQIDAGGSGAMIIARRVLERVKPAFMREWDENGLVKQGSDLRFCERARKEGFEIWCQFDYHCHHFKTRDHTELYKIFLERDIGWANTQNINTPEYWDGEWEKRPERILPFYERLAKEVHGLKVLDFGCGRGDLLSMLGPKAVGLDHSVVAIDKVRERGLIGQVGTKIEGWWDVIVATEVLEHLDDDVGMLDEMFRHTDRVIYTVPHDCLPPGLEKEHRRVYTVGYATKITPHLESVEVIDNYIMVTARRRSEKTWASTPAQCSPRESRSSPTEPSTSTRTRSRPSSSRKATPTRP